MKILLISLGKSDIYGLSIAKELQKLTMTKAIVSSFSENIDYWKQDISSLYEIITYRSTGELFRRTLGLQVFQRIKAIIDTEKPDIIYYPMASIWTPIINLFKGDSKVVCTIHDLKLHKGERNPIIGCMTHLIIKQSDAIILLNSQAQRQFEKKWRSKPSAVVSHGAFQIYFEGDNHRYQAVEGRANILFLGRILKYKGLDILLKAYPKIKRHVPEAKLIIAGQGSLKRYGNYLEKYPEIETRNWHLSREEIAEVSKIADVLVLPYIDASQSGVVTIGQAFGIPVISTKIGGIVEQIEDGVTGILVNPGNIDEFAEATIELLKDNKKREFLSKNEIFHANNNIGWNRVSQQIFSFLKEAIS